MRQKEIIITSQVSKKTITSGTPIRLMNKSQVSATSELSISKSQKSLSQGHSRVALKSGNQTLAERMDQQTTDIEKLQKENAQLRIMELSQDARQNLMKMQRFDRVLYPMQSDRIFKKPIQEELKRLQRIKNEQKEMRGKFYDNELTITALYNHIKLVHEMNRQLDERDQLKKQKAQLLGKMHEQKRQSLKEVRELKQQLRMGGKGAPPLRVQKVQKVQKIEVEQTGLKKEQITALNFIGATLKGKKYVEALQQVRKFMLKCKSSQPEICRLIEMFIPALQDQIVTITQTKTYELKITQITAYLQKINKEIRLNNFDQVEKVKHETLKAGSQYRNIGLLIESILNIKKQEETDKKKRGTGGDDMKSLEKVNQKAKTLEDQIKSLKDELFKERTSNADTLKAKQVLQKQSQKMKADIERLNHDLSVFVKNEAESKKNVVRPKANDDEIKNIRKELNEERNAKITFQKEVEKLRVEVETLRKFDNEQKRAISKTKQSQNDLKSIQSEMNTLRNTNNDLNRKNQNLQNQIQRFKQQEQKAKKTSKVNLESESLKQQLQLKQAGLTHIGTTIDRIVKATGHIKASQELEKIKKQLISSNTGHSRKITGIIDILSKWNTKNHQLSVQVQSLAKDQNEKKKKTQTVQKGANDQLTQIRQSSNILCLALKSVVRVWNRTKADLLFKDNKIMDILSLELKKGNVHALEQIQLDISTLVQSLLTITSNQIQRAENAIAKKLEMKEKEIERISAREQTASSAQNEKDKKIKSLEEESRNYAKSMDQIQRQNSNLTREVERLTKQIKKFSVESGDVEQKLSSQVQKFAKINKQAIQLKKDLSRVSADKQNFQAKLQQANQQISRLKKQTQDYVQQEKKVLDSLKVEGKEKQKYQRQFEILKSSLETASREKQFWQKKSKTQQSELYKLKQVELTYGNSAYETQNKIETLINNLDNKDRDLKSAQQKIRINTEQKKKQDKTIMELDKQLSKQKQEINKLTKFLHDSQDLAEKQKRDFNREIQKLNQQIKFDIQEREADRKHYSSVISRLQKNLNDAQQHRNQQIKQIQSKMSLILQEKEKAQNELQIEQNKYRQKLREVSRDLEYETNSGQKQKVQMKKQIDRLTVELSNCISTGEIQKLDLKKQIERLTVEREHLLQEKIDSNRIFKQEVERAKNQEYQINYEKLKRQREEIRLLQEEVDKLHEIIDTNESEYNKMLEQTRLMAQRIDSLQNREKGYGNEIQMLKDKSMGELNLSQIHVMKNNELSKYIQKLQGNVKDLELVIATNSHEIQFISSQKERILDLETKLDQLHHENIKYKIHQQQHEKQITKLKQQCVKLQAENSAIDRQLYAVRAKPDAFQNQAMLASRYEDISRKYEQINEQSVKLRIECGNFERVLKQRDGEILRLVKDGEQNRRLLEQRSKTIQNLTFERTKAESKLSDVEKELFIKDLNWQKQVQLLKHRIESHGRQNQEHLKLKASIKDMNHLVDNLRQQKLRMERQIMQLKNQVSQGERNIQLLQREISDKKEIIHQREIQLKEHFLIVNRSMHQQPTSVPDLSGTINLLERTADDRKRQIERLQNLLDSANKRYEQKSIEYSALGLELRHLRMEKQMIENNWKDRLESSNQRNKQLAKEIEKVRQNYDSKKEHSDADYLNLRLEKDKIQRNLEQTERKLNEIKAELQKIIRDVTLKDEQQKLSLEQHNNLLRRFEEKEKLLEKIEQELSSAQQQNKQLHHSILLKDQEYRRELDLQNNNLTSKINQFQRELQQKQKQIDSKELQIREYITKITIQTNQSSALLSGRQFQLQTSTVLLERTIEDYKRENERLQNQVEVISKKIEEKIIQNSSLLLSGKQNQMDKQLSEEQSKFKIETLSNKVSDLLREVESLRLQLKNSNYLLENERNEFREQRDKLERTIHDLTTKNRFNDETIQKERIEKATLIERQKSYRAKLELQDEELRKIVETQSRNESGNRKVKQENHYLKEIVHMLDTNYVEDEEEDLNEIKILMKISEEISYLIERNAQLQKKARHNFHQNDGNNNEWLSSIEFLIESLLDFLNQNMLIGHKNVTKFVYSAEFKAQSLYEHKEKYMVYVENFIKELFQSVVAQLSENVALYEKTFGDMKKFVDLYFTQGDHKYLQSLRRCLKSFD